MRAFTDEWARAWCATLNGSETYREVAANWEGSVALVVRESADQQPLGAVFLDLWHGECRGAREALAADLDAAAFVLEARPAAWRAVLEGRQAPLMALMTGQVRLARGELSALVPHAGSARELLRLVGEVATEFPDDW
ncbi:MAG: SCP2 sterol-binding domain-containing protein [Gemmatimonadales bacterium]